MAAHNAQQAAQAHVSPGGGGSFWVGLPLLLMSLLVAAAAATRRRSLGLRGHRGYAVARRWRKLSAASWSWKPPVHRSTLQDEIGSERERAFIDADRMTANETCDRTSHSAEGFVRG